MLLFHGGPVTRTHGPFFVTTALADSDASQRRLIEAAAILQEVEVRLRLYWTIVGAQTQVLIDRIGIDHFPGIHLPLGIPQALELAKGLDQLFAIHFVEEFGFGLSVSVLA